MTPIISLLFSFLLFSSYFLLSLHILVFNLANGIEVEMTKEKIEQYKKENQNIITKNRQKLVSR